MDMYEAVKEFAVTLGDAVTEKPRMPSEEIKLLRERLITEEYEELLSAMWGEPIVVTAATKHPFGEAKPNLPEMADAIADLLYVVLGTAVAAGINIRPIFEAVHKANLEKLGGGTDENGKFAKPAGWKHPDIAALLVKQGWSQQE